MRSSLPMTALPALACLALLPLAACRGLGPQPIRAPAHAVAPDSREEDYRQAARLRGQALAAMDAGDWERAIAALEELESLLPDNVLAPLDLAVCHQQLGNETAALDAGQRARALAPSNPRLLYALASIHHDADDRGAWEAVLDDFAAAHPHDPRPHYLRSRWLEQESEAEAAHTSARQAVEREPENLVLLVARLVTAGAAELAEETEEALDAVEDRLGGFDAPLADLASDLRREIGGVLAGTNQTGKLPPLTQVIRNVLRPDGLYRQHLIPLVGSGRVGNGIFIQLDFDPALPKSIQGGQDIDIAFVDRSLATGLDAKGPPADAPLDETGTAPILGPLWLDAGEARDTVLVPTTGGTARLSWNDGRWRSSAEAGPERGERVWSRLDVDQDGRPDLLVEDGGRIRLDSSAASATLVVADLGRALSGVFPVDVDHDGDLDFIASHEKGSRYLRNQGEGSWNADLEMLGEIGDLQMTDLVSADFDDDGDLDVAAVAGGGVRMLVNERHGRLEDGTLDWGLGGIAAPGGRLAVEDFDADGRFDLLVWSLAEIRLLRNAGDRFVAADFPATGGWTAATLADFDNDGDRDILAATGADLTLYRNRRDAFVAEPAATTGPANGGESPDQLLAGDYDGDGDLDVLGRAGSRLAYWRNDGGSLNHWLRVKLRGKNENNSKNNSQGLFVRLESRAGDSYQAILGDGGVNHLGLGAYRQADVLRVIWTNGLSQTWAALAADQTLDEEQVLKGSCPFLYTWNGDRFEFVTDLMWKSPLGMVLADGSPAPHQSARDFVLVPGDRLQPAGGELWLQVTEELWETVYVDRQQLLAIDYPSGVDLVVDEKFTPPPHPDAPMLHWVGRRLVPHAARGYRGRDVLPLIRARDGRHVDGLPLGRYQGTTEEHHLELDFEGVPGASPGDDGGTRLVLWGWIFPTDTSINVALSQNDAPAPSPPRLDLRTPQGWRTLAPSISFPTGKRKAMVIDLGRALPAGDVTLRLTTDMQIYWDAALLALGEPEVAPVITPLEPARADLHYRGFSRLVRETDSAPHLFDYAGVSTAPRFRDLSGRYTRFGPVRDLLTATDDLYVVMNAGDEMTVRFPIAGLPELPSGWRRDYILHTDGWVKDGDINTESSQTVEPLPHHGMASYPDPESGFPDGPSQTLWRDEYQTREVDDLPFRRQVLSDGTP
jgi:tetratricopeptide (TPR) repeat protein